jgi:hypothetical protein
VLSLLYIVLSATSGLYIQARYVQSYLKALFLNQALSVITVIHSVVGYFWPVYTGSLCTKFSVIYIYIYIYNIQLYSQYDILP